MRDIEVKWGLEDDGEAIADLLEFDGASRRAAFEERFIVAKEGGRVRAAIRVEAVPGRMFVWGFVADPRVREREFAVAVYRGAWELAREIGIKEVRADVGGRWDPLIEAGYRRTVGGWVLDDTWPPEGGKELPRSGWRRMLALLGRSAVPFFHPFHGKGA
ncbi:MAG: hypothetical protein ACRDSJ_22285 [Rubrobacteraceae bacterium]